MRVLELSTFDELPALPGVRLAWMTIHDAVAIYVAVMSEREGLWRRFGDSWGWPQETFSLEECIVGSAWHQKEGELGRAFAAVIRHTDSNDLVGCIYIAPDAADDRIVHLAVWCVADSPLWSTAVSGSLGTWLASRATDPIRIMVAE